MSRFEVGQRVVCVDDAQRLPDRPIKDIRRGSLYTIERYEFSLKLSAPMVRLVGVGSGWFFDDRFEPLPKKTTSIEVFQKMLNPVPEKVEP